MQMLREECHVLYSVVPGRTFGEKLEENQWSIAASIWLWMQWSSWKYLLHKCQRDLFVACACLWPFCSHLLLALHFSPDEPLYAYRLHLHFFSTWLSPVQWSRTSFSFQPQNCKLSPHLWIVTNTIPFSWNTLCQFSSLVWLYRPNRS